MGVSFLLSQKEDNHAFGCVFCVGEGRETAIFGNVETLCEHLVMEHGSLSGMSEKVMAENKCIVGRRAGSREDFDVNIPHVVEVA